MAHKPLQSIIAFLISLLLLSSCSLILSPSSPILPSLPNQNGLENASRRELFLIPVTFPSPAPPQPPSIIPNIILIVSDDQTWESIGKMPFLGTRSDWFRFPNAFVNVSLCCPSRANILSGLYSHHSGVEENFDGQFHDESSNLAVWLNNAGYNTGLFGKYLNSFPWGQPDYIPLGWDEFVTFINSDDMSNFYYDYALLENTIRVNYSSAPEDYSTDILAQKATNFLQSAREPFFLVFTPYTPHGPEVPAPRHENADVGVIPRFPNLNEEDVSDKPAWIKRLSPVDPIEMDNKRASKYRQSLAMDEAISDFIAALQQRGIFDQTVIIYLSDNGVSLGEHRYVGKPCEYEECIKTPLLVYYPMASSEGTRIINQLISNVDIAPSIAELAQAQYPPLDGTSFIPFLAGKKIPSWPDSVLLRWGGEYGNQYRSFWGIRTLRYKYIELDYYSQKELYDLFTDPYELENLAGNPNYSQIQSELAEKLAQLKSP